MIFHVYVKTNSKFDSIIAKESNELEIRICAAPVDGKANKYLINYLSKFLKVSKSSVVILKRLNNPYKTIEIIAEDEHEKNQLKMNKPERTLIPKECEHTFRKRADATLTKSMP